MTQADLQRDVERLETLRTWMCETADSMDEAAFEAFDRAIETARVIASMSDEQRAYLVEHSDAMAENGAGRRPNGVLMREMPDAHRKVARLMGGTT